jgi:hypothetical protein
MIRVVISYVEARPERMHEDIRELAIDTLGLVPRGDDGAELAAAEKAFP